MLPVVEPLSSGHPQNQGKVSPEWRLGWGSAMINLQIKYFFFFSDSESSVVNISSS